MNATPFRSPRDDAPEHTTGPRTVRSTDGREDALAAVDPTDPLDAAPDGSAGGHPAVRRILTRHAGRSPEPIAPPEAPTS